MPTNRKRKRRQRKEELTPEERQWLTGADVPGASKLWRFIDPKGTKVARCRELIAKYPHLVPDGHMAVLEGDLRLWSPREPTGLASFRKSRGAERE